MKNQPPAKWHNHRSPLVNRVRYSLGKYVNTLLFSGTRAKIQIARIASVSNRVIARKLELEQKKLKLKGGEGGAKRNKSFFLSLPFPFILLFCSRPNFLHELARKRLLRRQEFRHEYKSRHCTLALNWALGPREHTFSVSFATTHCLAYR